MELVFDQWPGLLFGFSFAWIGLGLYFRLRLQGQLKAARKSALEASARVVKGQAAEQLAPLAADFPYLPSDSRFLGSPLDYLVFDGLSEGEPVEIVFLEVKTGAARLTAREKRVREAVEQGRCRWEELRL